MPAPSTVDEFLDLTRKSGVVEEKRLNLFLERLRAHGKWPSDPKTLAKALIDNGIITHFQAEQLLQGKWRRFTIGKYKVLERLGSGGMGAVYLCEHKLMRRRVAVKVLPTAKAAEPSSLERFYREAKAVAALDHPNIVHAYDIDQDDTLHFLVMEYVDGASLQEIVKKSGPLDPVRASHYIYQSALGLEHAHSVGLVHRDIKPGNLLVDRGGTVKILDMGLARFFNDEEDILTKKYDETVLGTADYLAPEQAVDSHEADTRADIYSLGATFYFLLTGRTPFEEGTVAQKLLWHQTRKPKAISAFRSDVPAELLAVIERMMAKQPDDRYQHPRDVIQALGPWVQQPIKPPAEAELPRLSLAATGGAPETMPGGSPTQTGPGSSRKSWQVNPSPGPRTDVPAPASAPQVAAPATATAPPSFSPRTPATSQPAAASAPARVPALPTLPARTPANGSNALPEQIWADLADDTQPRAGAETLTDPKRAESSRIRTRATRPSRRLGVILSVVVAIALVAVGVLVWKLMSQAFAPPPAPERRPLVVTKHRSGERIYSSVAGALRAAINGDVIELADETWEENVHITAAHLKAAGVTLKAAPGKNVVWKCKPGSEDTPVLKIHGVRSFIFDGDRITLDGQGKMPVLMLITGKCPGVDIHDLHLRGYLDHGIKILNAAGEESKYLRIGKLYSDAPLAEKGAVVYLDAHPGSEPRVDDYLDLAHCLVPGMAPHLSLSRSGDSATGNHINLPTGFTFTAK